MTKQQFNKYIEAFDFTTLFNELGWNYVKTEHPVKAGDITFVLQCVAQKTNFKIFVCEAPDGNIPDYPSRKKLDNTVVKRFAEHLIIFTDKKKTRQLWQVRISKPNKPVTLYNLPWTKGQTPELLYQKTSGLLFTMDEEEDITIIDVSNRVNEQFNQNNEKVTKQFYERFKQQHTAFLKFIKGFSDKVNQEWYASLMLNRLMFCYFIQKKGFLDNNKNYLSDKLKHCQERKGKDKFYSFYRNFLLQLFHQGLGSPVHSKGLQDEIGIIPYLNGGLFDEHELEKTHAAIEIDDKAFESIFKFFNEWEWHLDTRHAASGKDINPDVIGFIFEKYINERADMGAYYTKEDITDYISKNCVIPWLFEETQRNYTKGFAPHGEIWQLVKHSGDDYIYPAIKHGKDEALPDEVSAGIKDISKRTEWNKPTPEAAALPTEIWRETIDRRNRYYEVKSKIEKGDITGINDFITYNLNIRQLAQDVIENTTDPEFLKCFYKALSSVTIIDPTCGSGAFLFAAMNILEPLYETCIMRMRFFIEDEDRKNREEKKNFSHKFKLFREVLEQLQNEQHPNLQYFIYKCIILRNLYGVDIMKEAVEIAKLRLFLKLVACVEADYKKTNLGLEPLPDVDFNIRSGNTLVGFATETELKRGLTYTLDGIESAPVIEEKCDVVARAFSRYKEIQLNYGDDYKAFKKAKDDLIKRLKELNHELNLLLYKQAVGLKYDKWLESYKPFHWFAEFYETIYGNKGFDIIIGNPPYVVYSNTSSAYKINGFETLECKDLYAYVIERSTRIMSIDGSLGMIVPISIVRTDGFTSLRRLIGNQFKQSWFSSFAMRPAKLFDGVEKHLSIFIANRSGVNQLYGTKYYRWYSEFRDFLFESLKYTTITKSDYHNDSIPKVSTKVETSIIKKIKRNRSISTYTVSSSEYRVYHTRKLRYFLQFLDTAPKIYESDGSLRVTSELKEVCFNSDEDKLIANSIYLSSLFFWYYITYSDCRNLNKREVSTFPFSLDELKKEEKKILVKESSVLLNNLQENSYFLEAFYKEYGNLKMQVFQPRLSKPIIDKIDQAVAKHYGFTDEELDFIINYDIKYRMGKELEEE